MSACSALRCRSASKQRTADAIAPRNIDKGGVLVRTAAAVLLAVNSMKKIGDWGPTKSCRCGAAAVIFLTAGLAAAVPVLAQSYLPREPGSTANTADKPPANTP